MPRDAPQPLGITRRELKEAHQRRLNGYLREQHCSERLRAQMHLLLLELLSHCSAENIRSDRRLVCWPGILTLAASVGVSDRRVRAWLRELEKTGVVTLVCGCSVPVRDRGTRAVHDGGFERVDGERVTTGRGYQFVFSEPLAAARIDKPAAVSAPIPVDAPGFRRQPTTRTPRLVSAVPPYLPELRAEHVNAHGDDVVRAFEQWVLREWASKPNDHPGQPFEFWKSRMREWLEVGASKAAARETHDAARVTHERVLRLAADVERTAAPRAAFAADLQARLARMSDGGARV